MLRRFAVGLWLATLLASLAWLLWRNQELKNVRRVNASMRGRMTEGKGWTESKLTEPSAGEGARIESLDHPTGTIVGTALTASSTNGSLSVRAPALTSEDRNELLKLRGQVNLLRREVAAATERQSATTRSAKAKSPTNHPSSGASTSANLPTDHYGPGLVAATLEISNLIHRQVEKNGGQVPATLPPDLTAQLGADATELLGRLELLPGEIITPETDCCILTAREREARQTADGTWVRLYFRADGSFTIAGPFTDPDWNRWERQYLRGLRESLRRRMQPK